MRAESTVLTLQSPRPLTLPFVTWVELTLSCRLRRDLLAVLPDGNVCMNAACSMGIWLDSDDIEYVSPEIRSLRQGKQLHHVLLSAHLRAYFDKGELPDDFGQMARYFGQRCLSLLELPENTPFVPGWHLSR